MPKDQISDPHIVTRGTPLDALPPPAQAEAHLIDYLKKKIHLLPTQGRYHSTDPSMAYGRWRGQGYTHDHDPEMNYRGIYLGVLSIHEQNRLLAQDRDPRRQDVILTIAYLCSQMAAQNVDDWWLAARLNESYLLPCLDAAHAENGKTVSRRQILQFAAAAYSKTGDSKHEIAVLQYLLGHADSPNTAKWARLTLAEAYESQKDYADALACVRGTAPVDQAWVDKLLKEQADAKSRPALLSAPAPRGRSAKPSVF